MAKIVALPLLVLSYFVFSTYARSGLVDCRNSKTGASGKTAEEVLHEVQLSSGVESGEESAVAIRPNSH